MSYCAIITFEDGKAADAVEFRNSWGGAARVWNTMFATYLKRPGDEHSSWLVRSMMNPTDRSLWDLAKRQDLPLCERAVHVATFDRAIIRRDNFGQFSRHLREFVAKHPAGECVCHLLSWAVFLESCNAEAVGFYATSASENLWFGYDEGADQEIPYDLTTNNEHFEVYDWLAEVDSQ